MYRKRDNIALQILDVNSVHRKSLSESSAGGENEGHVRRCSLPAGSEKKYEVDGGNPGILGGVVPNYRGIRVNEILDGTSLTFLAAEVLQGQGKDLRGFTWWGDAAGFETYLAPNSSQPDVIYTPGYCVSKPSLNLPCTGTPTTTAPSMYASRSRHPGGIQAVLCDGSARFFRSSISIVVWRALSTSLGNEAVTID